MTEKYAELRAVVRALESDLAEARESLGEALKADYPIQPGDVVQDSRGRQFLVHALQIRYERVKVMGRRKTKAGWHSSAFDITYHNLKKVNVAA